MLWAVGSHLNTVYGLTPLFRNAKLSSLSEPVEFSNGMILHAFHQTFGTLDGADGHWIDLEWTTVVTLGRNYSVSVQALNWDVQSNLAKYGQQDSYPGAGNWPTTRWVPEMIIRDRYFARFGERNDDRYICLRSRQR